MREPTPTRATAMALADERRFMRQGYEFLDEKRMLLASEMLRQLRAHQERSAAFTAELEEARRRLAAAVERHGLDQLQVYPAAAPGDPAQIERTMFLGLPMLAVAAAPQPGAGPADAVDPSPEAKACREAFEALLSGAAELAARAGNLQRLAREYRRTERRAAALEKVLLPEVEETMKHIDEQLDNSDREEIIRTRWASEQISGE